jgi:hypothetical protein
VERLARKFRLDDPVASRFTELIHRRKKDGEIDRMHKEGRGVAGNVLPKRPKREGNKLGGMSEKQLVIFVELN